MKKIFLSVLVFLSSIYVTFAASPRIDCGGLPGCGSGTTASSPVGVVGNLIAAGIKYVAVIAVIALMISGIMYLVSGGEEEKVKKAKTWIIWSLIGVLLSISSSFIINLVNNLYIY